MANYAEELLLFKKVLKQEKNSKDKIYSLHEPHAYCMSKGKETHNYEFGCKAAILITKTTGVIIGAISLPENDYDGHTLAPALAQYERLTGQTLNAVYADRGYRGISQIGATKVNIPKPPLRKASEYDKSKSEKKL